MSDLHHRGLLSQSHAHSVSAEHLEVLGKQAAAKWLAGSTSSLTEAVIGQVKEAGLSPEQVKRVVEFANTDAYLSEFKKEGSVHKFIDFGRPGPADPSEVLKSLNTTPTPAADRGSYDYENPPQEKRGSGEAHVERALSELFIHAPGPDLPFANPYGEALSLRDKLASAYNELGGEIEGLEIVYAGAADTLYRHVKEAAMSDTSMAEVLTAWQTVAPSADFAKVAFQLFTPRLLREGVYRSSEEVVGSMSKIASSTSMVNPEHPLVTEFEGFCVTLQKLAAVRQIREEMKEPLGALNAFFKQAGSVPEGAGRAAKGAWDIATAGAARVGKHVGDFARGADAPMVGGAAEWAVKHAPHAAALIAANEVRLKADKSPVFHEGLSVLPGTPDYNRRHNNGY